MLTLHKQIPTQSIIVTVSENENLHDLRLKLFSSFTNRTFYINLGSNISPYPSRYDEFEITDTDLTELEKGVYRYTIEDFDSTTNTVYKSIEYGLVKVIDDNVPTFLSITKGEKEDDFITYRNT